MECAIYREQTGERETIDCREDDGCQATLDRLAELKPDEFAWIRVDEPGPEELQRLGKYLDRAAPAGGRGRRDGAPAAEAGTLR
ncbi:hypothetical protein [Streptomyces sp. NPDC003877]